MGEYTIEIPVPVVQVDSQYDPVIEKGERATWSAWIHVGGVRVMERHYEAEWHAYTTRPDNFASDADDAEQMLLAEFGEKLKKLLEV